MYANWDIHTWCINKRCGTNGSAVWWHLILVIKSTSFVRFWFMSIHPTSFNPKIYHSNSSIYIMRISLPCVCECVCLFVLGAHRKEPVSPLNKTPENQIKANRQQKCNCIVTLISCSTRINHFPHRNFRNGLFVCLFGFKCVCVSLRVVWVTLYVCCLFYVSSLPQYPFVCVAVCNHSIYYLLLVGTFLFFLSILLILSTLLVAVAVLLLPLSQSFYTVSFQFWWSANSQNNFEFTCFIISTVLLPLIIAINWIWAWDQKTAKKENNEKRNEFHTVHSVMCEFLVFNFIWNRFWIMEEWTFEDVGEKENVIWMKNENSRNEAKRRTKLKIGFSRRFDSAAHNIHKEISA